MGFSTIFIRRPIATSLLMAGLLLLGILGYRQLPVSALPEIDAPSLVVTTQYPGANATTMASLVTTPLERQFGQISGLEIMTSDSSAGLSTIILQFSMDRDIDIAAQDVQAAIRQATLPSSLPYQPVYNRVNPADAAIVTLKLTSDTRPLREVNNYADSILAQRLSQVQGVGLVSIAGNVRPAVRIQVNPAQLSNMGLTLEELRSALTQANVNAPKGSLNGKTQSYSIGTNDQLTSAAEYRDTIISYRNGRPVRLSDVANVVDGVENDQLAAWADGKPAVLLEVRRQPGANIVQTVERIRSLLPQLQNVLPADVHLEIFSDRTETIRASVHEVQFTLILTIGLVVAVIFVFLRRLWATIIPSVAVPLSLAGTFGVMAFAGMSLDNLSLMALVVATGFVVDDAIVMLENIARHLERGETPLQAALKGARQIGFTLISLTLSLIAVLIPLLFMADVVGRLFHEFAITLAVAIGISLLVSLTLTPMMCARLLKAGHATRRDSDGRESAQQGDPFDRVVALYDRQLRWVLQRQPLMLAATVATLLLTAVLYLWVPKGFFPVQDAGLIQGISEAPQSISFQAMAQRQQALSSALLADEDVASLSSFIGVDGNNATLNSGRLLIELKPHAQRDADAQAIIARLQQRVAHVPGIRLYLQPVQELGIEDRISRTQYQFTLTSPDSDALAVWTPRLLAHLQQAPALADVASDLQDQGLQAHVLIDRVAAARLGIGVDAVADALYDAFGQRQISTIFTQANQYRVVLEARQDAAFGPDAIARLHVTGPDGRQVPLAGIARIEQRPAHLLINHVGQFPAVTFSFNLAEDASLGEAVAAIDGARAAIGLPNSVELRLQGAADAFRASLSSTLWLVLAAVVVMYLVLGVLYESFIHPITILSTLPSATVGALLALLLSGRSLDLIAVIGIVLLIGLVKKNAIMMIDFALEAEREAGLHPREAIHQAALLRFRPILMTTLAALFGAIPLMFASGSGAELRQPLGVVMVGGLIVSQVLTLFTTPVIYLFFDRFRRRPASAADTAEAQA
ncbi:MAG TPA: multidrug transporter subunit MdtC [Stenotrophomonas sp.]|nr:multidrug transporter subunit MdtC [Stenotrophomonas sp.]